MCIHPVTGDFLTASRRGRSSDKGLPGGTREVGETIDECLLRETFEELGIKLNTMPDKVYEGLDDAGYITHVYLVTEDSDVQEICSRFDTTPRETEQGIYVSFDPLQHLLTGHLPHLT